MKNILFPKEINYCIISNTLVEGSIKIVLLMSLDIAKFTPENAVSEIDSMKYNNLFYSRKLKNKLLKYGNLFDLNKDNRIILIITEFKDSLDPYQIYNNK